MNILCLAGVCKRIHTYKGDLDISEQNSNSNRQTSMVMVMVMAHDPTALRTKTIRYNPTELKDILHSYQYR